MSFGKFIVIPILLGIQAAILMLIAKFIPGSTQAVGGPGLLVFVAFQAWATYFMAGCTPKMGAKVVAGYQPVMPTYQGLVTEEQLIALIAYIESLQIPAGETVPVPEEAE